MIQSGILRIKNVTMCDHVLNLLCFSRDIEYGKAAREVLAVSYQRKLYIRIGHTRNGHDRNDIIVYKGLDTGTFAGTVVLADKVGSGDGGYGTVASSGQSQ